MLVPWSQVFANDGPVEVEIGPGRGDVLLALASAAPTRNFFGVEHAIVRAERLRAKAAARGLGNVRVVAGDARCILATCVPAASVAAYHLYFPDPWPKRRHRRRRLADPAFAAALARTLAPGGQVHVATDLPGVLTDLAAHLEQAGLVRRSGVTPPPRPRTAFEEKYAGAGTHYGCFARPA